MNKKYNFIFISTADWDNPFWTNKQHMAKILSDQGHNVVYFESLGLRGPVKESSSDRKRIINRLKKFFRGPRRINDNLVIFSPLIIPKHDIKIVSLINNLLMNFYLKFFELYHYQGKEIVHWTYNPLSSDFLNSNSIIYHCVDDLSAAPGMPVDIINKKEAELIKKAQATFVTSPALYKKFRHMENGQDTYYFPNVAEVKHFSKALGFLTKPEDLKNLKGSVLGFIGAISSYKVDFHLLIKLAKTYPECSIVLIGQVGEGQPDTKIDLLESIPNIHLIGPKSYESLPSYLKYFDVALLPCALNEYTKAMFPMKFFEYLAAEKKVVTTGLDSIQEFSDCCYISSSSSDFLLGVEKALKSSLEEFCNLRKLKEVVQENTWENRTYKMLAILDEKNI